MKLAIYRRIRAPLFWLAAAAVYLAAIMPSAGAPTLGFADKTDHLTAFATLTVLARMAYVRSSAIFAAVGLLGFGILIELTQAIPFIGRDASSLDVAADLVGIALGLIIAPLLRKWQPTLFA